MHFAGMHFADMHFAGGIIKRVYGNLIVMKTQNTDRRGEPLHVRLLAKKMSALP